MIKRRGAKIKDVSIARKRSVWKGEYLRFKMNIFPVTEISNVEPASVVIIIFWNYSHSEQKSDWKN